MKPSQKHHHHSKGIEENGEDDDIKAYVRDFKKEIERKFECSEINMTFSYPRESAVSSSSSDSSCKSLKNVVFYDLNSQNARNYEGSSNGSRGKESSASGHKYYRPGCLMGSNKSNKGNPNRSQPKYINDSSDSHQMDEKASNPGSQKSIGSRPKTTNFSRDDDEAMLLENEEDIQDEQELVSDEEMSVVEAIRMLEGLGEKEKEEIYEKMTEKSSPVYRALMKMMKKSKRESHEHYEEDHKTRSSEEKKDENYFLKAFLPHQSKETQENGLKGRKQGHKLALANNDEGSERQRKGNMKIGGDPQSQLKLTQTSRGKATPIERGENWSRNEENLRRSHVVNINLSGNRRSVGTTSSGSRDIGGNGKYQKNIEGVTKGILERKKGQKNEQMRDLREKLMKSTNLGARDIPKYFEQGTKPQGTSKNGHMGGGYVPTKVTVANGGSFKAGIVNYRNIKVKLESAKDQSIVRKHGTTVIGGGVNGNPGYQSNGSIGGPGNKSVGASKMLFTGGSHYTSSSNTNSTINSNHSPKSSGSLLKSSINEDNSKDGSLASAGSNKSSNSNLKIATLLGTAGSHKSMRSPSGSSAFHFSGEPSSGRNLSKNVYNIGLTNNPKLKPGLQAKSAQKNQAQTPRTTGNYSKLNSKLLSKLAQNNHQQGQSTKDPMMAETKDMNSPTSHSSTNCKRVSQASIHSHGVGSSQGNNATLYQKTQNTILNSRSSNAEPLGGGTENNSKSNGGVSKYFHQKIPHSQNNRNSATGLFGAKRLSQSPKNSVSHKQEKESNPPKQLAGISASTHFSQGFLGKCGMETQHQKKNSQVGASQTIKKNKTAASGSGTLRDPGSDGRQTVMISKLGLGKKS